MRIFRKRKKSKAGRFFPFTMIVITLLVGISYVNSESTVEKVSYAPKITSSGTSESASFSKISSSKTENNTTSSSEIEATKRSVPNGTSNGASVSKDEGSTTKEDLVTTTEHTLVTKGNIEIDEIPIESTKEFSFSDVPSFCGEAYVTVNDNVPYFTDSDLTTESYEYYSALDSLGRCGTAVACIGKEMMPSEERGVIGMVRPSGWHLVKYDCIDGKYLYNRCHLIGYQLSGENANVRNLITGTRFLNVNGMLPFENKVGDYVQATNNHVLYRATPIFDGNNLLASGVLIEAESVEDHGAGIMFCVFCYNAQPQIQIDYSTGDSCLIEEYSESIVVDYSQYAFILNTSSRKVHLPSCSACSTMNEANKLGSNASSEELLAQNYTPCGMCHPFETENEEQQTTSEASSSYNAQENTQEATASSIATDVENTQTNSVTTSNEETQPSSGNSISSETENTQTVFVSNSGKIHIKSNCSGMKHYTEMTYDEAIASGYTQCKKCYG